jgi:hypothetical protein
MWCKLIQKERQQTLQKILKKGKLAFLVIPNLAAKTKKDIPKTFPPFDN